MRIVLVRAVSSDATIPIHDLPCAEEDTTHNGHNPMDRGVPSWLISRSLSPRTLAQRNVGITYVVQANQNIPIVTNGAPAIAGGNRNSGSEASFFPVAASCRRSNRR